MDPSCAPRPPASPRERHAAAALHVAKASSSDSGGKGGVWSFVLRALGSPVQQRATAILTLSGSLDPDREPGLRTPTFQSIGSASGFKPAAAPLVLPAPLLSLFACPLRIDCAWLPTPPSLLGLELICAESMHGQSRSFDRKLRPITPASSWRSAALLPHSAVANLGLQRGFALGCTTPTRIHDPLHWFHPSTSIGSANTSARTESAACAALPSPALGGRLSLRLL